MLNKIKKEITKWERADLTRPFRVTAEQVPEIIKNVFGKNPNITVTLGAREDCDMDCPFSGKQIRVNNQFAANLAGSINGWLEQKEIFIQKTGYSAEACIPFNEDTFMKNIEDEIDMNIAKLDMWFEMIRAGNIYGHEELHIEQGLLALRDPSLVEFEPHVLQITKIVEGELDEWREDLIGALQIIVILKQQRPDDQKRLDDALTKLGDFEQTKNKDLVDYLHHRVTEIQRYANEYLLSVEKHSDKTLTSREEQELLPKGIGGKTMEETVNHSIKKLQEHIRSLDDRERQGSEVKGGLTLRHRRALSAAMKDNREARDQALRGIQVALEGLVDIQKACHEARARARAEEGRSLLVKWDKILEGLVDIQKACDEKAGAQAEERARAAAEAALNIIIEKAKEPESRFERIIKSCCGNTADKGNIIRELNTWEKKHSIPAKAQLEARVAKLVKVLGAAQDKSTSTRQWRQQF